MPTRDEFLKLVSLKEEKAKKESAFRNTMLKQAAVKADYLTKNEHWDFYLSALQAKLDDAVRNKVEWMERAARAFAQDDIKFAQLNFAIYDDRCKTLEEVMGLPNALITAKEHTQ